MIRYSYNSEIQPPAPFVYLNLRNPADGTELSQVPAQIDTAADRTVLPDSVVNALGLSQIGTTSIGGFGGIVYSLPAYVVDLAIHDLAHQPFKVIASPEEPWVLLGRDVLNTHRFLLDGPGLALEIG